MNTHNDKKITIHIDKKVYHVNEDKMTGAAIKLMGGITGNYDLVLINPGRADDQKIADDQIVQLYSGMKFMGITREITPGGFL